MAPRYLPQLQPLIKQGEGLSSRSFVKKKCR